MPHMDEPTGDLYDQQQWEEDQWEEEILRHQQWEEDARLRHVCAACGGSALSPYPEDGGSCPHCVNGVVRP
jgi:hypothetical protein